MTFPRGDAVLALSPTAPISPPRFLKWLSANGWTVVTSELGYIPKHLPDDDRANSKRMSVNSLQTFEDHDDVHRVWAAIK